MLLHTIYAPKAFPRLSVGVQHGPMGWQSKWDVVKENQDGFVQVVTKKSIHHVHELGKGVGDAKRHDQKFIEPPPRLESNFMNISTPLPLH